MSAENEAHAEGTRIVKQLSTLRSDVLNIDASDTQRKERALQLIEQSRERLRAALTELAGLV